MFNTLISGNMVLTLCTMVSVASLFFPCTPQSAVAGGTEGMKTIEGSIFYRERMMLPPTAEVFIFLEDSAKMDIAAEVVARTSFSPQGGPPWDFVLEYDPAKLRERGRYGLRVRIEAEGRLLFINTSHIPAFERDPGIPIEIMVSRVDSRQKTAAAQSDAADAELRNTYWKLMEMEGEAAPPGAGGKEVHMVLSGDSGKVQGFGGCNQFSGSYELNGRELQFGPLMATKMACMDGMELEQSFLQALESVRHFSINGEQLSLRDAEDRMILRFKSVYLE